jgi:hypothetical protein
MPANHLFQPLLIFRLTDFFAQKPLLLSKKGHIIKKEPASAALQPYL